jgi:hypothetical protein
VLRALETPSPSYPTTGINFEKSEGLNGTSMCSCGHDLTSRKIIFRELGSRHIPMVWG